MSERVLICGDRDWRNQQLILDELSKIHQELGVEVVIEGENGTVIGRVVYKGADLMGRYAAERLGIPVLPYPANWRKYGLSAGPIRNRQILTEGKPTLVLAFHNFLENSKGTKDMVQAAMNAGIKTQIIKEK
jgi:hypothetical protein